ncbi:MAG: PAQR family membrane homeostasis protein TrhA [Cyclobacteriaceae bacterium]|jgi:hemolysin III|nr:hemolysin III family protein [Flammeovirgaceae bacterium]
MSREQTQQEEVANAVTHGIGAVLAVVALIFLVVFSVLRGTMWHVVGFTVFGVTLVLLYFASTLYHSVTRTPLKKIFRKVDHIAIYLLIAGTYTPFCLTVLRGWMGWTFLGIMWGCALVGAIVKAVHLGGRDRLSTFLYLAMGWVGALAFKPLYEEMSGLGFALLAAGGLSYSLGTIFYMRSHVKYNHSVWHVFVLAGSIFHFFAVLTLLPS